MTLSPSHRQSRPNLASPPRPNGPQLVPSGPPRPRHSLLALWHLLSLDAPTVAALWTLFIARCNHLSLPWSAPAAMFAAVWMIYAADRLLDARALDTTPHHPDLEPRHHFHHHHRTRFITVIVLAAFALAALLHDIDPRALHLYALLATLLAAWMLLIHTQASFSPNQTPRSTRLPKELAVGIFFPAAIFIPTLARTNPTPAVIRLLGWTATWLRPHLLLSALVFAALCTLNCLSLYAWENPAPRLQAHWTTRWATSHLTHLALAILTLSTLTSVLSLALHEPAIAVPAVACALSTAALLALNHLRHRLSPIHLRAAADLVLLTPLLLLPLVR